MQSQPRSRQTYRLKARRRSRAWIVALAILATCILKPLACRLYQQRKFDAAVDALHAAGEPVLVADFNRPRSNDQDNPVSLWRAASSALDEDSLIDFYCDETQLPFTAREASRLRAVVEHNPKTLALAQQAASKAGRAEWGVQITSPVLKVLLPDLGHQRAVANVLMIAAFDAHQRGDDGRAIELIHELLAQERALYRFPTVVGHYVAVGAGAMAVGTIRHIVPDLRIDASGNLAKGTVTPEQVKQVINELLEERPQAEGRQYALQFERMELSNDWIHLIESDAAQSVPARLFASYAMKPTLYSVGREVFRVAAARMSQPPMQDWPTFQSQLALLPNEEEGGVWDVPRDSFITTYRRVWERDFMAQAEQRLCALALAIRMYEARNHELPRKLDDLVPNFIWVLPADPMARGPSLRYRFSGLPVIYSVGEDGIDDGGSETVIDPRDPDDRWNQRDVVLHLTRQKRSCGEASWATDQQMPAGVRRQH